MTPAGSGRTAHLIDATGYLFRSYYAIRSMTSPDGLPTNGVYGLLQTVLRFLRTEEPQYAAAVFDAGRESFRNEIYPEYKANRGEPPEDLVPQFDLALEVVRAIGLPLFRMEGFEADDLLGTLTRLAVDNGFSVRIYSGDKDLAQLVDGRVRLLDLGKETVLDADGVRKKFGVSPKRLPDLIGLTGDPIDNIPGVPGVGPVTARALLGASGSLDALLDDLEVIDGLAVRGREGLKKKLLERSKEALLSRRLATIRRDVPLDLSMEALRWDGAQRDLAGSLFEKLGFERSLDRVPRWA
jgi:DNA polymerase-1